MATRRTPAVAGVAKVRLQLPLAALALVHVVLHCADAVLSRLTGAEDGILLVFSQLAHRASASADARRHAQGFEPGPA